MFTTRSALTACVLISQHSLTKSRCVFACWCSGLWSPSTHLAGFLYLKRMHRRTSVTRRMCSLSRVMSAGDSKVFLPSGARGELRFQRCGVFSSNVPAQAPDLTQALRYAPFSCCPPVAGHVEEPVSHEGVDVDFAAFCHVAAGLVFNECSGWSGWESGTKCWYGRSPHV